MDISHSVKPKRVLGIFVLATLNLAVITSLRNMPLVARYGLSSISYYLIAAIVFIVPTALVSAELATGWPKAGGVYIWVREAFGERWGLSAVWLQWLHNLPWYPAMLAFIGTLLAYAFNAPSLIANKNFMLLVILLGFWGITFINFFGVKTSGWFSSFCVIIGAIIPGLFLITLGLVWMAKGMPTQIQFEWNAVLPSLSQFDNIGFLAATFLAFAGLEVTAVHAKDVKEPRKNFPKAIFLSAIFSLVLFVLGSLAIAIVLPKNEISLVAGIMEAFAKILSIYKMSGLVPITAILIALGAIGELNAWILGLAKGLFITARHGSLPPVFQKVNKHNIPTNLLLFQASVVSASGIVFYFMDALSSAYWVLMTLSAQLYLTMYILMFLAGLRLRYSKPNVVRKYRISEGNGGMWIVSMIGTVAALFAIVVGFMPPKELVFSHTMLLEFIMIGVFLIFFFIPHIIFSIRKPSWVPTAHKDLLEGHE
ncbi:MAG: Glutamate/gamma-aminobutyrate antiporter [Chlamydiae bacterium]|nr:Glutamate/gamma-aminobutyrate antiporter [Chlamydiota bacterium]